MLEMRGATCQPGLETRYSSVQLNDITQAKAEGWEPAPRSIFCFQRSLFSQEATGSEIPRNRRILKSGKRRVMVCFAHCQRQTASFCNKWYDSCFFSSRKIACRKIAHSEAHLLQRGFVRSQDACCVLFCFRVGTRARTPHLTLLLVFPVWECVPPAELV